MFFDAVIVIMSGVARRESREHHRPMLKPDRRRPESPSTPDEILAQHKECAHWLRAGEPEIRAEMERRVAKRLARTKTAA